MAMFSFTFILMSLALSLSVLTLFGTLGQVLAAIALRLTILFVGLAAALFLEATTHEEQEPPPQILPAPELLPQPQRAEPPAAPSAPIVLTI